MEKIVNKTLEEMNTEDLKGRSCIYLIYTGKISWHEKKEEVFLNFVFLKQINLNIPNISKFDIYLKGKG